MYANNYIDMTCVNNDAHIPSADELMSSYDAENRFPCTSTTTQAGPAAGESGDYSHAIELKVESALADTASAVEASSLTAEEDALSNALLAAEDALLRVKDILDAAKFTLAAEEVSPQEP